jgi:phosphoserine phosphatase
MKYRLAIFDVDSTLIEQEVIDLLAAHTPYGSQVADITARAMAGELEFDDALKERVALLKDLPSSIFTQVLEEISFSPGAEELLSTLKNSGCLLGVVSGGFHNILDELFAKFNLDFIRANTLEVIDEQITGRTLGPIVNREGKARALREFADAYEVPLMQCIAVGDGSNDLDMVELAGLGVSYRGKPILNAAADVVITDPGLERLLKYL